MQNVNTTNTLYLTDNQELPIATSSPVAVNHHGLYQISSHLDELFQTLTKANISTDGLFVNADAGFYSKEFRIKCFEYGIIPNIVINPRNGNNDEIIIFDEMLYQQRYTIEISNAWLDSYRSLLNRFEATASSCKSLNYIAFMIILLKK